ncbi:hypothetical protein HPP92_022991 [Vanilla planifolia]|uniref:Uncharacterized protein n=1 Tax=Vanilla planifolia TaxID=51239 RepID=A0A835PQN5_VANPL|nr:hypothetical protein HPP92_022991 [Vanilla planifolia]
MWMNLSKLSFASLRWVGSLEDIKSLYHFAFSQRFKRQLALVEPGLGLDPKWVVRLSVEAFLARWSKEVMGAVLGAKVYGSMVCCAKLLAEEAGMDENYLRGWKQYFSRCDLDMEMKRGEMIVAPKKCHLVQFHVKETSAHATMCKGSMSDSQIGGRPNSSFAIAVQVPMRVKPDVPLVGHLTL